MYITTRKKRKVFVFSVLSFFVLFFIGIFYFLSFVLIPEISEFLKPPIPSNVVLSNLGPTSATITWVTDKRDFGKIYVYRDGEEIGVFHDDRGNNRFQNHYVNIQNLEPDTRYTFKISLGEKLYSSLEETKFEFFTTPILGDMPIPNIVRGRIANFSDNEVVVFVRPMELESPSISTYVSPGGEWSLDLSRLLNSSIDGYLGVNKRSDMLIQILFSGIDGGKVLSGNNNLLFDDKGFLSLESLEKEVDIYSELLHNELPVATEVMGETDSLRDRYERQIEDDDLIVPYEDGGVFWRALVSRDRLDDYGIK